VTQKEFAFVLRSFPATSRKICALTKTAGKADLLIHTTLRYGQQLLPGALFSGSILPEAKMVWRVNSIEVVMYPMPSTLDYFYLFHHILELSYYFLPLHMPCSDLFRFIYNLFMLFAKDSLGDTHFLAFKGICMLKFLVLSGFYPNKELCKYLDLFDLLVGVSIDLPEDQKVKFVKQELKKISDKSIRVINEWVMHSLEKHPCNHLFKTVRFFEHY
jgi:hypothetical protein